MARRRNGMLRSIDTALCYYCKEPMSLYIDGFGAEVPAEQLSGHTATVWCEHCGREQAMSCSIEWQTFPEGGE